MSFACIFAVSIPIPLYDPDTICLPSQNRHVEFTCLRCCNRVTFLPTPCTSLFFDTAEFQEFRWPTAVQLAGDIRQVISRPRYAPNTEESWHCASLPAIACTMVRIAEQRQGTPHYELQVATADLNALAPKPPRSCWLVLMGDCQHEGKYWHHCTDDRRQHHF